MKRKLLREFADYLGKKRNDAFLISDAGKCVSAHALKFMGATHRDVKERGGSAHDLERIFDMPTGIAQTIYGTFWVPNSLGERVSKNVAVRLIRRLANTGRLDWDYATAA